MVALSRSGAQIEIMEQLEGIRIAIVCSNRRKVHRQQK
jgi:hypothetical protein